LEAVIFDGGVLAEPVDHGFLRRDEEALRGLQDFRWVEKLLGEGNGGFCGLASMNLLIPGFDHRGGSQMMVSMEMAYPY